jgi:hypothetical protein
MTVTRQTKRIIDNFDRALTLSATPEGGTGWTVADTSSSGTPTYLTVSANDGGALVLTCDNTSEAQNITVFQNDILCYDLAYLQHVWWVVKVAGIDNTSVFVAGVGAAQADDEDTVVTNAWLKIEGATSTSALVAETDDGTNDNNDVATGTTLSSTYKKLHIDFTNGLSDVMFFVDGARVASSTTFDMSDLTSGLNVQPYLQLSKASGTGTPSATIAQFGLQYEFAYGS